MYEVEPKTRLGEDLSLSLPLYEMLLCFAEKGEGEGGLSVTAGSRKFVPASVPFLF